ncbi:MAG: ribbon-helix-helix domain-containing protein [Alphaproteobacteria bacterium]|nr:ribbon-helix-helix domain-containing protein [Alphaproteobacteria bacterium]
MKKISVSLSGHQTSISIEDEFIVALNKIARDKNRSVASIIQEIDSIRTPGTNLSSAVRVWILRHNTQSAI